MAEKKLPTGVGKKIVEALKKQDDLNVDMVNNNDQETIDRRVKECYAALDKCYPNNSCPIEIESLEKKENDTIMCRNAYYPNLSVPSYTLNDVTLDLLDKDIIITTDLYDTNNLVKLFHLLDNNKKRYENITIATDYDKNKNNYDLEINMKLLTFVFGVKVLSNIYLTNEFIKDVVDDDCYLRDYIIYKNSFVRFIPTNESLNPSVLQSFIKFVNKQHLYNSADLYSLL